MPDQKLAFIFPAFASEYPEDPCEGLPGFEKYFRTFLQKASGSVDNRLSRFHYSLQNFLDDELRNQYISYILSCSLADYFRDQYFMPGYSAGYSMGIYASLYQAGAISFEDGLQMIRLAYHEIRQITEGKQYGMGTVIGLSLEDIERIIARNFKTIEITNQNSIYSFVLSGSFDEIITMVEIVRNEGALHTRLIQVTVPYHSTIIQGIDEKFTRSLAGIPVLKPQTKIISLADQSVLQDADALKKEVIRNLFSHLNWFKTQLRLQELGVTRFLECGPGSGLVKNSKFISGDFTFSDSKSYMNLKESRGEQMPTR